MEPNRLADKKKIVMTPTLTVATHGKPPLSIHYMNTFNAVDRFDVYMEQIEFNYRQSCPKICWLISLLRFATINCWTIWRDLHYTAEEAQGISIKDFTIKLSNQLMNK